MQPQLEQMPAEMLALDDRRLEAELRGADSGDIAAGAGADDDDVVGQPYLDPFNSPPGEASAEIHRCGCLGQPDGVLFGLPLNPTFS